MAKITIRAFNPDNDYEMLREWWVKHGSYPPKVQQLSKTGVIVEVSEEPVCCGFLYKTDSKIVVFEFVVSNPATKKTKRDVGLKHLIQYSKLWTQRNDFELIYTSVGSKKYISRLEEGGFTKIDTGQTHMFHEVSNE